MSRFPFRLPGKVSLEGLQSELSNLVERWWHCGVNTGPLDGQDWAPPVELTEDADCFRLSVELPGVPRSAIDVTAVGTTLQIIGDKLSAGASDSSPAAKVVYSERRYGGFKRLVNLPGPVRVNEITAVLTDGVLTVTLPKATGTGPQDVRIPVRTPNEALPPT